ncbi:MAG: preprotein translocase subunit SecE [Oscillospiraceae bacterium]|nr:preprotein translocase subunit SecE [Oscillospiraceae bacterium]
MAEETKSEKSKDIEKIDAPEIKIKKAAVAKPDSDKPDKQPDKPAKKDKPSLMERFKKFLKDYKSELKKIVWPTRTQTIQNTGVVVIAILFMTIVVGLLDLLFGWGITGLSHVKSLISGG